MAIRLPPIEQTVKIDVSSLAKAIAAAEAFQRKMDKALDIKTERFLAKIRTLEGRLGNLRDRATDAGAGMHELGNGIDESGKSATAASQPLGRVANAVQKMGREAKSADPAVRDIGKQIDDAGDKAGKSAPKLALAAREAERFGKQSRQAASGVGALAIATSALNAALSGKLLGSITQVAGKIGLIGGAVGAAGAGIGQLAVAMSSMGGAVTPVLSLLGVVPSMLAGIGAAAIAIKAAFSGDTMKKPLDALKASFKGVGEAVRKETTPAIVGLFGQLKTLAPAAEAGFKVIGSGLATVATRLGEAFNAKNFGGDFQTLLAAAGRQTAQYGTAIVDTVKAITDLSVAGIPVADKFAGKIRNLADGFRSYASSARGSGELGKIFDRAYQVGGRLVGVITNLFRGLRNLSAAGNTQGIGETFLGGLERMTQGIRDFAQNNRTQLTTVFQNANQLLGSLGRLVTQVAKTITLQLGTINLSGLLDQVTTLVRNVGPGLTSLGASFVGAFTKILGAINGLSANGLSPILGNISRLTSALGDVASDAIPAFARAFDGVTQNLGSFVRELGGVFNTVLPNLGKPIQTVVESTERLFVRLATALAPFVNTYAQPIADAFAKVQDAIGNVATQLSGPFQSAAATVFPALQSAFDSLLPVVQNLFVAVGNVIASFAQPLAQAITAASGFLTPMISIFRDVAVFAAKLPDPLKAIVVGLLAFNTIKKIDIFANMLGPSAGTLPKLKTLLDDAKTAVGQYNTRIASVGKSTATGLSGITTTMGRVGTAAGSLVRGALGGLMGFLGGPLGVALIGVTTLMTLFSQSNEEAARAEQAHQSMLGSLRDTLDRVTGSLTAASRQVIGKNIIDQGLDADLKKLGTSVGEFSEAMTAGGTAAEAMKQRVSTSFQTMYADAIQNSSFIQQGLGQQWNVTMDQIVDAWAGGSEAWRSFVEGVARDTGQPISFVEEAFQTLQIDIDNAVGSDVVERFRALGNQIGDVGTAAAETKEAFKGLAESAFESAKAMDGFDPKKGFGSSEFVARLTAAAKRGEDVRKVLASVGITGEAQEQVIAALGDTYNETTGKMETMSTLQQRVYDALVKTSAAALAAQPNAQKLADSIKTLGDNAQDAASKASALNDILNILAGGTLSVVEAQGKWFDTLDTIRKQLGDVTKENKGVVAALNEQKGAFDAADPAQRKFFQTLSGSTAQYASLINATYESVKAKKGEAAALDAVSKKATEQRTQFTNLLTTMGLTPAAAGAIADALGLIPENVVTAYKLEGVDELTRNQISVILAKLAEIPGKKTVTVEGSSITRDTIAKLKDLGYTVKRLPNGKIQITDNIEGINKKLKTIDELLKKSKKGTVTVDAKSVEGATEKMKSLGLQVSKPKNGKVTITDNTVVVAKNVAAITAEVKKTKTGKIEIDSKTTSDQAMQRLAELGYTVTALPNGKVVITDNTEETKRKVQSVVDKLSGMPADTPVTVTALTADAEGLLESLGYTVTHMPDGTTTVTANAETGAAEGALAALTRDRSVAVYVQTIGTVNTSTGNKPAAAGDLMVKHFAGGGFTRGIPSQRQLHDQYRRATPMSASRAQIVPPNTPRLIGDNMRFNELFVPLNPYDPRAVNLMMAGIRAMGGIQRFIPNATGSILPKADTSPPQRFQLYDPASAFSLVQVSAQVRALASAVARMSNVNSHDFDHLAAQMSIQFRQQNALAVRDQNQTLTVTRQLASLIERTYVEGSRKQNQIINIVQHNPVGVPSSRATQQAMATAAASVLLR